MATVTKPIALDESFNTTETPSRNIADVLASLGDAISQGAQPVTKKLATNSFKTINGGLVDGLTVQFTPVQDLHGQSKPWAGGAGKNLLPLTLANLKTENTGGTWVDNVYTYQTTVFTVNQDSDGNVIGVTVTGSSGSGVVGFYVPFNWVANTTFTFNGCPSGGSSSTYRLDIYDENNSFVSGVYDNGSGNNYTPSASGAGRLRIRIANNYTVPTGGVTFYPMIRLASIADPTFEPYSNICPISGHTEAKAKINDTVYTTSLGGTYYGGEVEQVSGAGESTFIDTPLDLSSLPFTYNPSWGGSGVFSIASSLPDIKAPTLGSVAVNALCEIYKIYSRDELFNSPSIDGYAVATSGQLLIRDHRFTDAPSFISAISGVKTIYELATPTTLTLTDQSITAEVGENNVSAPLDGQNIKTDSVIYKDMFTWEDVLKVI